MSYVLMQKQSLSQSFQKFILLKTKKQITGEEKLYPS